MTKALQQIEQAFLLKEVLLICRLDAHQTTVLPLKKSNHFLTLSASSSFLVWRFEHLQ